ncbi:MAG: hypothetical protein M3336_06735, partial [Chloroflexota bacterium]|nr:hypothetical protein [Chloroflexota bacterium]
MDAAEPQPATSSDGSQPSQSGSAAIRLEDGAHLEQLHVHGDVAGRDIWHVTEDLTFDVSDLSANPYRGLASFTYETRHFFGGREQQIAEAVHMLTADGDPPRLVFVTGGSGSGKSSFVQAGVLPALETHYAPTGVRWTVMRPGRHPFAALTRALTTAAEDGGIRVLVLDQFEELFTQSEPAERDATLHWLTSQPTPPQVIATLRSDYLPRIFDLPPLLEAFKKSGIELRAMTKTELARAIRQPLLEQARRDGKDKRWQPALVDRLIEDVGSDSTLLPLLQVTLTALCDQPPHRLVLERYRTLTDALEQQAEHAYAYHPSGKPRQEPERQQVLDIFLDLVEVSLDDDPQRDVRRTISRRQLVRDIPERAQLIDQLVEARLLATTLDQRAEPPTEMVDIIHETLLRNWPRLRAAVHDAREHLQRRVRFRLALQEWLEHNRSDDYLLDGVRLAEARQLTAARDIAFSDQRAVDLLQRSTAREEEERQRELGQARALAAEQQLRAEESTRSAQRLRRWLAATATAGVIAVVAAIAAISAFVQADRQARMNASRELATASQLQNSVDSDLAILLAREGVRVWNTDQAHTALREALARSAVRYQLQAPGTALTLAAFSPDGQSIATAADDGSVRVWQADTGAE